MILHEMGMLTYLQDDDNTVEGSDIPEVDPSGHTPVRFGAVDLFLCGQGGGERTSTSFPNYM